MNDIIHVRPDTQPTVSLYIVCDYLNIDNICVLSGVQIIILYVIVWQRLSSSDKSSHI